MLCCFGCHARNAMQQLKNCSANSVVADMLGLGKTVKFRQHCCLGCFCAALHTCTNGQVLLHKQGGGSVQVIYTPMSPGTGTCTCNNIMRAYATYAWTSATLQNCLLIRVTFAVCVYDVRVCCTCVFVFGSRCMHRSRCIPNALHALHGWLRASCSSCNGIPVCMLQCACFALFCSGLFLFVCLHACVVVLRYCCQVQTDCHVRVVQTPSVCLYSSLLLLPGCMQPYVQNLHHHTQHTNCQTLIKPPDRHKNAL
jgi:hypothetical protein